MSDIQNGQPAPDTDAGPDKHEQARRLAEAAVVAQDQGEDARADALMDRAEKTDPDAVEDVLAAHAGDAPVSHDIVVQSDEEIAAISRTIEPGSDAPSRAGITGSGSGADGS